MNSKSFNGLLWALLSATAFGSSGSFAKGLLVAGWSPAAAVTLRVAIGALALALPAAAVMRGRWHLLRRGWPSIVSFGLIAVAGCQLAYFFAIERLPVGVAMLIEYSGVIMVVGWLWLRRGQRPRLRTMVGAGLAVIGLLFVLDVFGTVSVDLLGALFALAAAVGLASFFVLSADDSHGLPPLVLATGGLLVGAVVLLVAGATGLVPFTLALTDVTLAGVSVPWWVDVAALGFFAAAVAYGSGVTAARHLGSKLGSFVGLSEVLFAVLWAWLLLGELPLAIQLLGGVLVVAGVVAVRMDEAVGEAEVRRPGVGAPDVEPPALIAFANPTAGPDREPPLPLSVEPVQSVGVK